MKKDLVSIIAAAVLGVTTMGSQSGCVHRHIHTHISEGPKILIEGEARDASIKRDLEEITKSVFCVKTEVEYRRQGAKPEEQPVKRGFYGTAFAYNHADGYTYLVTNAHIFGRKEFMRFGARTEKGVLRLSLDKYVKSKEEPVIVTDLFDKDKSDDVKLEIVARDEKLDIAIIRTKKKLPVARSYIKSSIVSAERGDDVYIVGYPRAVFNALTKGTVSKADHLFLGERTDMLDIKSTFGNSGSPYFFRRGATLYMGGIVRGMMPYKRSNATHFTLGIPMKYIAKMLYTTYSPVKKTGGEAKKK